MMIDDVWEKATIIDSDPDKIRRDLYGNIISKIRHNDEYDSMGWTASKIDPKGDDNISNLQPLQYAEHVRRNG